MKGYFDWDEIAAISEEAARFFRPEWHVDYGQRLDACCDTYYQFGACNSHGTVMHRLDRIVQTLTDDPESRDATVGIHSFIDSQRGPSPCPMQWQWLIRHDKLQAVGYWRSWDAYLGVPYDSYLLGAVTADLARRLRLDVGDMRIYAGSAHVYQRDLVEVGKRFDEYEVRRR